MLSGCALNGYGKPINYCEIKCGIDLRKERHHVGVLVMEWCMRAGSSNQHQHQQQQRQRQRQQQQGQNSGVAPSPYWKRISKESLLVKQLPLDSYFPTMGPPPSGPRSIRKFIFHFNLTRDARLQNTAVHLAESAFSERLRLPSLEYGVPGARRSTHFAVPRTLLTPGRLLLGFSQIQLYYGFRFIYLSFILKECSFNHARWLQQHFLRIIQPKPR